MLMVRFTAIFVPWSLDFSAWHSVQTAVAAITVIAVATWGFATALGGQSIFKDPRWVMIQPTGLESAFARFALSKFVAPRGCG